MDEYAWGGALASVLHFDIGVSSRGCNPDQQVDRLGLAPWSNEDVVWVTAQASVLQFVWSAQLGLEPCPNSPLHELSPPFSSCSV